MKLYLRRIVAFCCMGFLLPAFAVTKPNACPTIHAIQQAEFDSVERNFDNPWQWTAVTKRERYDTQEEWSFSLINIQALTQTTALMRAKEATYTLLPPTGPTAVMGSSLWICAYPTTGREGGIAVSPPLVGFKSQTILSGLK